ncbi:hypothetical protein ACVWZR_007667 [Bradyrhizobium sp. i1.3.1]
MNRLDKSGHVHGVPDIIECENDEAEQIKARSLVNGCGVEVWDGTRKVASFPSDIEGRPHVNLNE